MSRIRYWWPLPCAAALVWTLACMGPAALAQSVQSVPDKIPYQGSLNTIAKDIIIIPPGKLQFRLYATKDAASPLLWSEEHENNTKGGVYNVVLGDGTAIGSEPHPSLKSVLTTKDLWLQVSTTNETTSLASRQRFAAVPYALTADTAVRAKHGAPAGTISVWAGAGDKIPEGWLACNGTAYSKTADSGKYAALATAIGTVWGGSGDNFNVPNFGARVLTGAAGGRPLGTRVGTTKVKLTKEQLPIHNHVYYDTTPNLKQKATIRAGCKDCSLQAYTANVPDSFDTDPAGGGEGHLTVQPSTAATFIIKY